MKIQIEKKIILAMQMFAGRDASRYVICKTVNFEVSGLDCFLVATDGRALAAIKTGLVLEPPTSKASVTVSIDTGMLKALKALDVVLDFALDENNNTGTLKISPKLDPSTSFQHKLVEGNFPTWRMIMPRGKLSSPVDPTFDWRLLEPFIKAGEALRGTRRTGVSLRQSDPLAPILIRIPGVPDFVGAIMPFRSSDNLDSAPDWALEQAPQTPPPAAPPADAPSEPA